MTGTRQQIIPGKVPGGEGGGGDLMYHKSSKSPHRYTTLEEPLYHLLQRSHNPLIILIYPVLRQGKGHKIIIRYTGFATEDVMSLSVSQSKKD